MRVGGPEVEEVLRFTNSAMADWEPILVGRTQPAAPTYLVCVGSLECALVHVEILELEQPYIPQSLNRPMGRLGSDHQLNIMDMAMN